MGNQHSEQRNNDSSTEKSGLSSISGIDMKWGTCPECKKPNTGWNWCQQCNSKHFQRSFQYWTSNNEIIDEFIRDTQMLATTHSHVFEWIPYKKFYKIEYITRGGFGKVYSATWLDGRIMNWDAGPRLWKQYKHKQKVALKTIYNGMEITREFLAEIKSHAEHDDPSYIANWFGISQDPLSKEYIMVMKYFEHGSIRDYLRNNHINWLQKMKFIRQISFALSTIHECNFCHRNLHTGNILVDHFPFARISDLGQGHLINTRGESGDRPQIKQDVPSPIVNLIQLCWDGEYYKRPTAKQLVAILENALENDWKIPPELMDNDKKIADEIKEFLKSHGKETLSDFKIYIKDQNNNHPEAIYKSRELDFSELSESMDSYE
ncbi:6982_t:CDS:2, partial [Cetraspora pellucida]